MITQFKFRQMIRYREGQPCRDSDTVMRNRVDIAKDGQCNLSETEFDRLMNLSSTEKSIQDLLSKPEAPTYQQIQDALEKLRTDNITETASNQKQKSELPVRSNTDGIPIQNSEGGGNGLVPWIIGGLVIVGGGKAILGNMKSNSSFKELKRGVKEGYASMGQIEIEKEDKKRFNDFAEKNGTKIEAEITKQLNDTALDNSIRWTNVQTYINKEFKGQPIAMIYANNIFLNQVSKLKS